MKHKCTHYFGLDSLNFARLANQELQLFTMTQNLNHLSGNLWARHLYVHACFFFLLGFFCLVIKINNTDNKWGFKRHITHTHIFFFFIIICIRPFLIFIYLFVKDTATLHKTWACQKWLTSWIKSLTVVFSYAMQSV